MPHVELPQAEFKVVLLGDTNTGKTSLVLRFVEGSYNEQARSSTMGAFFLTKRITIHQTITCKMLLWDTAGQTPFQKLARTYYQTAAAVILTYDVSQPQSLHRLRLLLEEITQFGGTSTSINSATPSASSHVIGAIGSSAATNTRAPRSTSAAATTTTSTTATNSPLLGSINTATAVSTTATASGAVTTTHSATTVTTGIATATAANTGSMNTGGSSSSSIPTNTNLPLSSNNHHHLPPPSSLSNQHPTRRMVIAIAACKMDLDPTLHHPGIEYEAQALARQYHAIYIPTSARTNSGVSELFEQTAERVWLYHREAVQGIGLPIPVTSGGTVSLRSMEKRGGKQSALDGDTPPTILSSSATSSPHRSPYYEQNTGGTLDTTPANNTMMMTSTDTHHYHNGSTPIQHHSLQGVNISPPSMPTHSLVKTPPVTTYYSSKPKDTSLQTPIDSFDNGNGSHHSPVVEAIDSKSRMNNSSSRKNTSNSNLEVGASSSPKSPSRTRNSNPPFSCDGALLACNSDTTSGACGIM